MSVRIKFSKTGMLQFISHLDLNRTMKNILLRSKIPVHYSEGFNPRPKLAFGLPLSVGAESVCEYMDFKIDGDISYHDIKNMLNKAFPNGLEAIDCYEPVMPLSDITLAEYLIKSDEIKDIAPLLKDEIILPKRSKKGTFDTNIKPFIKSAVMEDGAVRVVLSASPEEYLNPEYIAKALGLQYYDILRTEVYTDKYGCKTVFR